MVKCHKTVQFHWGDRVMRGAAMVGGSATDEQTWGKRSKCVKSWQLRFFKWGGKNRKKMDLLMRYLRGVCVCKGGAGRGRILNAHTQTHAHAGVLIHGRTAGCPIWRLPLQSRCRIPSLFWIWIRLLNPPPSKKEFSPREEGWGWWGSHTGLKLDRGVRAQIRRNQWLCRATLYKVDRLPAFTAISISVHVDGRTDSLTSEETKWPALT